MGTLICVKNTFTVITWSLQINLSLLPVKHFCSLWSQDRGVISLYACWEFSAQLPAIHPKAQLGIALVLC